MCIRLYNKNQQKINQSKQIKMTNFQETTAKQYVLAKFQPGNILLINRHTKQAFNYFQVKKSQSLSQQLKHPYLLRPLFYGNGLLYPKAGSNLRVQLENRKRAFSKDLFTEDELVNTFSSLFECIEFLHKNNIVHAQIHPENIVLIDGEIKLRDWLIQIPDNVYYSESKKQNRTRFDDYTAIGQILAQYATLTKSSDPFDQKDIFPAIESVIDSYSKSFVFTLLVLLKKKAQFYNQIIALLNSKDTYLINNFELNSLYTKIKSEKENKVIKPQPVQKIISLMPTPKKSENILVQASPNKKFNITQTAKKSSHRSDDAQNKKVFNEEVKKRQIEKITKIIERSNAFVNELMARKNTSESGALKSTNEHNSIKIIGQNNQQHVLKKISGKNNVNLGATFSNMSMYAIEPTKKMKQTATGIIFSPNKRVRTISRKK